jgi:hypothetical protein
VATLGVTAAPGIAQTSAENRVLAQSQGGFNPAAVRSMLAEGDAAASRGDLAEARADYDKARKASKQLLAFYRDLSGAFRVLMLGSPARWTPRAVKPWNCWRKPTCRLAALFRRQNQPEVAVPVLVEVVKLMTPAKPQGQKAYQSLLELGFVETEFRGASDSRPMSRSVSI